MQGSQKALLRRRAFGKAIFGIGRLTFCKVSLSLLCVSWGLLFLLSLWLSRSDGYGDGSGRQPSGTSIWDDKLRHNEYSCSVNKKNSTDESVLRADVNTCYNNAEARESSEELHATTESTDDKVSAEKYWSNSDSGGNTGSDSLKTDRQFSVPIGLDEFKSRAFSSKSKAGADQAGGVVHRVEPGGQEYNYASSSKGAKVLAFNKEAKGASNILGRDKDKYLRNPCSVEGKFVVIELSEETLVDTIEIANFEHHSSNLKDFELLGSLVYPTSEWVNLGNFTAANVKLSQRFVLPEPKWVRYLKLNLLSHYGTEFYCTLSVVEVFGVDAVERMLEDLISVQDDILVHNSGKREHKLLSSGSESPQEDDIDQAKDKDMESKSSNIKLEGLKTKVPDPVEEIRLQQVGRAPGDSVLKVLLQKVRNLDLSISVLERYLEEINSRYGNLFKDIDQDLGEKDVIMQRIKSDVKSLFHSQVVTAKDIDYLMSWKSHVSSQLDGFLKENLLLRSTIKSALQNQRWMENKGIAIFLVTIVFGLVALVRLLLDILLSVYMLFTSRSDNARKFCDMSYSWLLLLISCCVLMLILSL